MTNNFLKILYTFLFMVVLSACSGGSGGITNVTTPTFDLTCDMGVTYTPFASPIVSTATGATTTVIALHGKNGSPTRSLVGLSADLNALGYDVSMPYMPWHDFNWDGTLCEAMSYINSLIVAENNAGRSVILLGHSLAGPIVLSYTALSNSTKPDAVTVMAPGHFVPNSFILNDLHAPSVLSALALVAAGLGDVISTFQSSNGGTLVDITTTPNIYLSYHDPAQFPDILASISIVSEPVLWLAGQSDSLTNSAIILGVIDTILVLANYDYREIAGTHFSLVNNVPAELDPWYQGL